MALSTAEKNAIAPVLAREGLSAFFSQVQAMDVSVKGAAALATLTPAITVTVQNWATLQAYVAAPPDVSIGMVMSAIANDAAAQNAARLGPLLVALYAAEKVRGGS